MFNQDISSLMQTGHNIDWDLLAGNPQRS